MKHILITGLPGVGKTTLVCKLIKHLTQLSLKLDGFITEEIRNDRFQRTGFCVKLIKSNASAILADKASHSPDTSIKKLGQYTVYVKNFEDFTLDLITSFENGILVIDEIGKMELFSKKFEIAVSEAFKRANIKILATVPVKGPTFVENLKMDTQNNRLVTITRENRENILSEILKLMEIEH